MFRLVNHNAFHDYKYGGISNDLLDDLISILEPHGKIIISSERRLPDKYNIYKYKDDVKNFHHYLSCSKLVICDGQSVAVECAILGIPNIRFNNFIGKISILNEIESKYNLSLGIKSSDKSKLLKKVNDFVNDDDLVKKFKERRKKLIEDKISFNDFLHSFIVNYCKN